jgi:hypothetical protein
MKVTTVSANIRYSQDTGKGAWKAVEIGAEATVDQRERWDTALVSLYADLGQQLKALWANGNGRKATEAPTEAAETPKESEPTPPTPAQTPEHYCQQHQTEYKRYTRGDSAWYSHKTKDGKWCREK